MNVDISGSYFLDSTFSKVEDKAGTGMKNWQNQNTIDFTGAGAEGSGLVENEKKAELRARAGVSSDPVEERRRGLPCNPVAELRARAWDKSRGWQQSSFEINSNSKLLLIWRLRLAGVARLNLGLGLELVAELRASAGAESWEKKIRGEEGVGLPSNLLSFCSNCEIDSKFQLLLGSISSQMKVRIKLFSQGLEIRKSRTVEFYWSDLRYEYESNLARGSIVKRCLVVVDVGDQRVVQGKWWINNVLLKNAKTTEERQRIFNLLIGKVKTPINTKLVTEGSSSLGAPLQSTILVHLYLA
ncbi:hypothetical protein PPACK8108_LOCUS24359 [Phakopsora pachyrhizi]|uniref:Uncharacterized protein n=1 Tax=Phakopsora pachyrhizi TaxID=170000 RepID=A0AAV0BSV7_PHAPC|nr:hypothetical protein PPACK8108_LOCUS24359 [Phakopsora pachyrhizi]